MPHKLVVIPRSWWLIGLAGLLAVALLPFVGHYLRGTREDRCNWDGLRLEPVYEVRIIEPSSPPLQFCCVSCAELWIERNNRRSGRILVTDEISGGRLEAASAHYVRSAVVTNEITGNRLHVFRSAVDAKAHADSAMGRILAGSERPFKNTGLTGSESP